MAWTPAQRRCRPPMGRHAAPNPTASGAAAAPLGRRCRPRPQGRAGPSTGAPSPHSRLRHGIRRGCVIRRGCAVGADRSLAGRRDPVRSCLLLGPRRLRHRRQARQESLLCAEPPGTASGEVRPPHRRRHQAPGCGLPAWPAAAVVPYAPRRPSATAPSAGHARPCRRAHERIERCAVGSGGRPRQPLRGGGLEAMMCDLEFLGGDVLR